MDLGIGCADGDRQQLTNRVTTVDTPSSLSRACWDSDSIARFSLDGYRLVPGVLDPAICDDLIHALTRPPTTRARGGLRDLFAVPLVITVARSPAVRALVEPLLGGGAAAVRATLFDKVHGANWRVPWHRDRLIAVRQRCEVPGFSAWSMKNGVDHVEPPRPLLDAMIAVRLHLDPVDHANAPLRVLPGSHRLTDTDAIHESAAQTIVCARGAALIMRPLLYHASAPALTPDHRRVLHLEYAAGDLPGGLEWHDRW